MKEIELLKTIFKDSPDILEPLNEIDKEIERLNKDNGDAIKLFAKEREETKRLHSIIKEAREYIEDRYDGEALTHTFDKDNVKELLEILQGSDKE